jgi:hypothetical protein
MNLLDNHIIYIGRKLNSVDGGAIVSKRNVSMLNKISRGKIFEFYLSNDSFLKKIVNVIMCRPWGYSNNICIEIKNVLSLNKIGVIFIDHSLLGGLSEELQKFNVKIVVFFHNVEVKYYNDKIKIDGFFNRLMVRHAIVNEKSAIKNANKIICLTDVDSELLNLFYGRKADLILPITLDDNYNNLKEVKLEKKQHLFVGSYFFANIDAINWYIDNVLPFIDSRLVIIGSGMDKLNKLSKYSTNPKIQIYGFVNDLNSYYNESDFVINPIRLGSGMKTKTIEAFMYGKTVIGTPEAFVGINNPQTRSLGIMCNSSDEFIERINNFNDCKFNSFSRIHYLENFSAEVGYLRLKEFLEKNIFYDLQNKHL